MLQSVNDLRGYNIIATDGAIGHIEECYFDDTNLTVRYVVANTENWLTDKHYLISPMEITHIECEKRTVHISLTKDQLIRSPGLDKHHTQLQQMEKLISDYYGNSDNCDEPLTFTASAVAGDGSREHDI